MEPAGNGGVVTRKRAKLWLESQATRRSMRMALGLFYDCPRPAIRGRVRCPHCLEMNAAKSRRFQERVRANRGWKLVKVAVCGD